MPDVTLRGDSAALFAAALELAEVGLSVRLELGDAERWPAGPVPDHSGSLRALLESVAAPLREGGRTNTAAAPETVSPRRVVMRDRRGDWSPVPDPSVLGVPAVPVSEETLKFLKTGDGLFAYLDRIRPLLTIGKTREFGKLVRSRMGEKLLKVLVEPLVRERYGVTANEVEVAVAAPGLNEALTRAGSLSGAVLAQADHTAERETLVGPVGGWAAVREALIHRLGLYGVEVVEGEAAGDEAPQDSVVEISDAALDPELGPVREHAHVRIEDPGIGATDVDAMQTVVLEGGQVWSVRAAWDGEWTAKLVGPRAQAPGPSHADAALGLAGWRPVGGWHTEWRAAPEISRDEREARETSLEARRQERSDRFEVGDALHGDDASAAVHDAVELAVTLRRRLTGIAE